MTLTLNLYLYCWSITLLYLNAKVWLTQWENTLVGDVWRASKHLQTLFNYFMISYPWISSISTIYLACLMHGTIIAYTSVHLGYNALKGALLKSDDNADVLWKCMMPNLILNLRLQSSALWAKVMSQWIHNWYQQGYIQKCVWCFLYS